MAPWTTPVPVGIPKTGFPTEQQAHVAARNIAAQVRGEQPTEEKSFGDIPAVCVMDAGNNGVLILADKMLPPRKHGVMIPGPQSHAMKLAFEKYFLWKSRNGYVNLPSHAPPGRHARPAVVVLTVVASWMRANGRASSSS